MAVTVLTEASPGAPVLSGLAGSLTALLDYCLVTTMGWTKAFTGTNQAAYKQPAGSNGFYLAVDDSAGQNARMTGFEAMTSVTAGTNPFPTASQLAGGLYFYKSSAATNSARVWTFISNGSMFYLIRDVTGGGRTGGDQQVFCFGDIFSYKGGDTFGTVICGEVSSSVTSSGGAFMQAVQTAMTGYSGHYITRANTQIGGATQVGFTCDIAGSGSASYFGAGTLPYPSPIDGQMHLSPIWVGEPSAGKRGVLPGVWHFMHPAANLNGGDTFTGGGNLAGKSFLVSKLGTTSGNLVIEISDTWAA